MRWLIFSDSHGRRERLEGAVRCELAEGPRPELIVFLGDGLRDFEALGYSGETTAIPMLAVRGNCDLFDASEQPTLRRLNINGHSVLMTHGHEYGVKMGLLSLTAAAAKGGHDLVLYGHTHQAMETRPRDGLVLFNPGSIGSGSYGVITLEEDNILCEIKSY